MSEKSKEKLYRGTGEEASYLNWAIDAFIDRGRTDGEKRTKKQGAVLRPSYFALFGSLLRKHILLPPSRPTGGKKYIKIYGARACAYRANTKKL